MPKLAGIKPVHSNHSTTGSRYLCVQVPDDEVTEMSEATEATDATDISEASDQDNNKKASTHLPLLSK